MKPTSRLLGAALAALVAAAALPAQPVAAEGRVVIASTQVPRHLNGAVQSGIATAVPSTQIFASPLRYDDAWNPQPYLAESWSFSEDGLSLTLNLREGVKFHDGRPLTSKDVAFSIMTIKANHPFQSMFAPVTGVDTPDDGTAIIRLSQPHPALLLALSPALAPIIPEHVYGDGQDVKSHPANAAPIGAGPFKLKEFTPGEVIILEKNPDYFLEGLPKLDEIVIRIIRDESALLIAVENGEVDLYPFASTSQAIRRLEKVERLAITDKGYAGIGPIVWLAFNTQSEKLSDKRVRQAIAYAIDRDFITRALHRGVSTPQRSPIIESSPFFDASMPAYDTDLDKAKALLAEAGVETLTLTVDYIPAVTEQQQNIAEYLRSQLGKIGIEIEVRASPDFPTWAQRVSNGDFELTMDNVFNWGDPVIGVHRTYLSTNIRPGVIWSNTQGYANPRVDELLNAAAVELDVDKRKALYAEFQRIVGEELPIYWINATPYHTIYDRSLVNVPTNIWGVMSPMDELAWGE